MPPVLWLTSLFVLSRSNSASEPFRWLENRLPCAPTSYCTARSGFSPRFTVLSLEITWVSSGGVNPELTLAYTEPTPPNPFEICARGANTVPNDFVCTWVVSNSTLLRSRL
jgi:hypothetical protein